LKVLRKFEKPTHVEQSHSTIWLWQSEPISL